MNWVEKKRQRAAIMRLIAAQKILPPNVNFHCAIDDYIASHNKAIENQVVNMRPLDIFNSIKEIHQAML